MRVATDGGVPASCGAAHRGQRVKHVVTDGNQGISVGCEEIRIHGDATALQIERTVIFAIESAHT